MGTIAQELPENQGPDQVHIGIGGAVTPYAEWYAGQQGAPVVDEVVTDEPTNEPTNEPTDTEVPNEDPAE